MNKKFSTLMALALLAGGASAQYSESNWKWNNTTPQGAYRTFETRSVSTTTDGAGTVHNPAFKVDNSALANGSAWSKDVNNIQSDLWYQLEIQNDGTRFADVLVQERDYETGEVYLRSMNKNTAPLNASLWKIMANDDLSASGPDFTFVNKATGTPLSVDLSKISTTAANVVLEGSTSAWKWEPTVSVPTGFMGVQSVYSYFKKDSVIVLSVSGNQVQVQKEHASKATTTGNLKIAPATAGSVVLTAKDLNTWLGSDPNGTSFKLNSDKTTSENSQLGNVFREYTFRAWNGANATWLMDDFILYAETSSGVNQNMQDIDLSQNGEYVLLQIIDNDKNGDDPFNDAYLLADTSYIAGTATNLKLVKFGTDTIKTGSYAGSTYLKNAESGRDIKSHMFKFEYWPTPDSIAISVKSYMKESTSGPASAANPANGTVVGSTWTVPTTNANIVTLNKLTEVTEITLTDAKNILGQVNKAANVRFFLGLGNDNRSTEANGLFYIKNKAGQYLAVPIDKEGYSQAEWVTVKADEQNVAHMPAYQWVVLKNNNLAPLSDISSLEVTNREFPGITTASLQLFENDGAAYKYAIGSNLLNIASTDSVDFVQITDATVLGDSLLGYMNKNAKELQVMTYKFNYLHPYSTERFIGKNDNDSLLAVLDNVTPFYLEGQGIADYGYEVTADVVAKIPGLKQLRREAYVPYVKTAEGNLYMDVNAEDQYCLTDNLGETKFYFKENNHYQPEGAESAQCYYAMIDLNNLVDNNNDGTVEDSTKVGITDDDMSAIIKNQVLHETRTSAFAVVPNDAPLYRRFNTELEDAIEGQEDAAKLLRFKEFYRGEYLMDENNANFQNEGVAYVGIERADRVAENAGLSFMVDTAILNATTSGKIKPQYFIMVNREVVNAVPGEPCDATDHQHLKPDGTPTNDPDSCFHAIPGKAGYVVANYMVSFQDSVTRPAYNADKLYKFGEYTRVGFVKGLHIGDSLYILTNGFEKMAAADLDTADIRANYKATKVEFNIIDLKAERTDAHHNYTWSFRYVDPEAAAAVDEEARRFLIESNVDKTTPVVAGADDVAPTRAAWLKNQNGCLVLSDPETSEFENAKTGGDNALIFNIEVGSEDDMATDNEEISTSEVTVIAGNGQITIAGAAGKKVVVSNILGQVVANTVLTSDNATIAAPQGVVVVAVEGEEAVKAIVK